LPVRYVEQHRRSGGRECQRRAALLAGPILTHELTRPLAALVGFTATREEVVAQVAEAWLRLMVIEPAA
jgi:hypothetical protein